MLKIKYVDDGDPLTKDVAKLKLKSTAYGLDSDGYRAYGGEITAERDYTTVKVYVKAAIRTGKVYWDDISLIFVDG